MGFPPFRNKKAVLHGKDSLQHGYGGRPGRLKPLRSKTAWQVF
jgi:hypothetical protein